MSDELKSAEDKLAAALGTILVVAVLTVSQGYVLSVFWRWFCVPLGCVQIGIAHSIGLMLIFRLATARSSGDSKRPSLSSLLEVWLAFAFILGMGWIVHLIMGG